MTPVSIMRDVWDPLGFHLDPKDLKSGQKRPSYGQFTNGRLRDSSEYHARCKGPSRDPPGTLGTLWGQKNKKKIKMEMGT